MKTTLLILICTALVMNFTACKPKTRGEKIEDKVKKSPKRRKEKDE